MIRFAADEDFENDPRILAWAASDGRVLLTHDVSTMSKHAIQRVSLGQPMPGVLAVHQRLAIGNVIEDLVLVVTCSTSEDWAGQVNYLPLRS